jgi:hypothetical protein
MAADQEGNYEVGYGKTTTPHSLSKGSVRQPGPPTPWKEKSGDFAERRLGSENHRCRELPPGILCRYKKGAAAIRSSCRAAILFRYKKKEVAFPCRLGFPA